MEIPGLPGEGAEAPRSERLIYRRAAAQSGGEGLLRRSLLSGPRCPAPPRAPRPHHAPRPRRPRRRRPAAAAGAAAGGGPAARRLREPEGEAEGASAAGGGGRGESGGGAGARGWGRPVPVPVPAPGRRAVRKGRERGGWALWRGEGWGGRTDGGAARLLFDCKDRRKKKEKKN